MRSIRISIPDQTLELTEDGKAIRCYPVSTSKNGVGEKNGSFCTPRGRHIIRAKVGTDAPVNTVFIKRRPTGEIYDAELGGRFPGRDWMLTRLLWLSGCEPGFNRLGDVDTMRRYIYIHGSPDTAIMGKPGSIGCIRMHNSDIVELFELVEAGTPVEIAESTP
jgi:lipoprotein-anchoring transpeptidase ErfK/SrfK